MSTTNYDILDLLEAKKREIFLEMFCHGVGTVQKFYPDSQTADVTVNYLRTFPDVDSSTGEIHKPYPPLLSCPVHIIRGGTYSVRPPIQPGDECLISFNDRDIDNWHSSGQVGELNTARLHDFSDACVFVGFSSVPRAIPGYDPAALEIGSLTSMLRILESEGASLKTATAEIRARADGKIRVKNSIATLGSLVQQLLTVNETLVSAIVNTTGIDSSVKATILLQYQQLALQFQGLLE